MKVIIVFVVLLLLLPTKLIAQDFAEPMDWPELVADTSFSYPFSGRVPWVSSAIKGTVPKVRKLWQQMQNEVQANHKLKLNWEDAPPPKRENLSVAESLQTIHIAPKNLGEGNLLKPDENEWSGIYVLQHTEIMSTVFRWSPSIGFVGLGTESCGAIMSDISYGDVTWSANSLRLFPTPNLNLDKSRKFMPIHLPTELVPIKWGGAHYLVSLSELKAFCDDYVAGLGTHRNTYVRPFIKVDDENENELSKPLLPKKYAKLAKRPVVAKVRALRNYHLIKKSRNSNSHMDTEVVLNVGKKSGVKKGMSFIIFDLVEDPQVFSRDLEIIDVNETSSIGIFSRYLRDNDPSNLQQLKRRKKEYFQTVKVGMRACIRPLADVGTAYPRYKK